MAVPLAVLLIFISEMYQGILFACYPPSHLISLHRVQRLWLCCIFGVAETLFLGAHAPLLPGCDSSERGVSALPVLV